MKHLKKAEVEEEIKKIGNSELSQEQIKKIKRLAMHYNIKLKEKRKLFCKKCYSVFPQNTEIRIKQGKKIVRCKNCGYIGSWKLK